MQLNGNVPAGRLMAGTSPTRRPRETRWGLSLAPDLDDESPFAVSAPARADLSAYWLIGCPRIDAGQGWQVGAHVELYTGTHNLSERDPSPGQRNVEEGPCPEVVVR
jgi:hypothetical protein